MKIRFINNQQAKVILEQFPIVCVRGMHKINTTGITSNLVITLFLIYMYCIS